VAKDYAEAFLTLLVIYRDISASEAAASVEDIMNKAGVERDDLPEILDLIDILTEHKIIEKRAG